MGESVCGVSYAGASVGLDEVVAGALCPPHLVVFVLLDRKKATACAAGEHGANPNGGQQDQRSRNGGAAERITELPLSAEAGLSTPTQRRTNIKGL